MAVITEQDLAGKGSKEVESELHGVVRELASIKEANGGSFGNAKDGEAERVRELNDSLTVLVDTLEAKRDTEGLDEKVPKLSEWLEHGSAGGGNGRPPHGKGATQARSPRDLGGLFLESEAWGAFRESGTLDRVSNHPIASLWPGYQGIGEVPGDGLKAALFDSTDFPIQPDFIATPVEVLYQPNNIGPLFAQGTTNSNVVRYVQETVTSTGAAETAEGITKPEADVTFAAVDENVRKIAVLLPLTDESLDDVPFMRAYLNARLRLFVQMREDLQLLAGNGTAPNLRGILNRSGINTTAAYSIAGANPDQALIDQTFVAMMQVLQAFLDPDAIVMKPSSWQIARLAKDAQRNYLLGRPADEADRRLWGLRVILNANMPAQSAGNKVVLVGAFRAGAMVVRRSGIDLAVSDSHSTFFAENKVAIRAEERLALCVWRPAAFAVVTSNA